MKKKIINEVISQNLSEAFAMPITVRSWVMSENTEENPDWHEKDERLSLQIIKFTIDLMKRMKINDIRFSIADRSWYETEPHYAIDIQIGGNDLKKSQKKLDIDYLSKVNEEEHSGDIKTAVNFVGTIGRQEILVRALFEKYCRLLDEYYPEFSTSYFERNDKNEPIPYENISFEPEKAK